MARGDMFLKIDTTRQGPIKGESHDEVHLEDIDVVAWRWGMRARTAMGAAGEATGKAHVEELEVVKRVDRASTALMAAMRNNELIKKVELIVRKAGGASALEYVLVTLEKARLTSVNVFSDEEELTEKLTFAFERINVVYTPQGQDGQARGKTMFETDVSVSS